jgi:hypothetical protein
MGMMDFDTRDDRLMPDELLGMSDYPVLADQHEQVSHGDELSSVRGGACGGAETEPKVRTELATSLHFILSQYLRPSTLRRLIGPRDAMIGRVMLGRTMQGEVDDDLLARILAQAIVEHIRQSGFVVQQHRTARHDVEPFAARALEDESVPF